MMDTKRPPVAAAKCKPRRRWLVALLGLLLALAAGVAGLEMAGISVSARIHPPSSGEQSAHTWATPVERPGLPNLHQVSPSLYRGAQPTAEGMQELKKMGVRTVVNLRSFHSDRDELGNTGLAYEHIHVKAWHPENEDVIRFLQIVTDAKRTPVFVHCQHGADRTGTMCAIYRIVVEGWTKDEAIREMTGGGFGYHEAWENLVTYIRGLDVDQIRKSVHGAQTE